MAGVSTATVSRYINSSGYVDDSTAKKLKDVIAELNYTPNKIAKGLKTSRSQQIALIVPNIENPYYSKMSKSIQYIAQGKGFSVVLFDTSEDEKNEVNAIKQSGELGADGLIFCSINRSQQVLKSLKALNKPVVISNSYDELVFDTLHSIGGKGIYLAAKYLIELGHRKIGYVGGPISSSVNQQRKDGFILALQEMDIAPNKDLFFEMDFSMDTGYKAGKYFSSLNNFPTAICAANDIIAMGILLALNEQGIKIPDDISLTGEDNIEFSRVCRPSLTTINNSESYFAENAMSMLLERINGSYTGAPRNIVCPRELIVRESTKNI
jgi:DNA-binding LacI/PurR family transcriptional regulator